MSKLSVRLKELREDRGLSVKKLAKALGVSDMAIIRWEKEERVPNADSVILIAQYFGVSSDYLLGLSEY